MYLKSIMGEILYEGRFFSVRKGVENAIRDGVVLNGVDLRHASLIGANLSGVQMKEACLWGADLRGANLSLAQVDNSDFRLTRWDDTNLIGAHCTACDFSGAVFDKAVIKGADWQRTTFSHSSVLQLPLHQLASARSAIYSYRGESVEDLMMAYKKYIPGYQKKMA